MDLIPGCLTMGNEPPTSGRRSPESHENSRGSQTECRFYQELFDFAPVSYLVTDPEGTIHRANHAAASLLNVPSPDLSGKSLAGFIAPPSRRAFRSSLNRLRRNAAIQGRPLCWLQVWPVRPRGSQPADLRMSISALRSPDGRLVALCWLLHTPDEREAIEAETREPEGRARSLLDQAPIGIIETDADRRCLYTNARWQAIAGMAAEESLGYGWSRVLHPDDREATLKEWSKASREGNDFAFEHRIVTPDEAVRWVQVRSTPLYAGDGSLAGHLGCTDDITERKAHEAALHASEERFRALTERSWDAVSLIAADGTILYDNPAASTRILGYATVELLGHNAFNWLHPEDQPRITEQFLHLAQAPGSSTTAEFRYRHKDGSWRWIECVGTNLLCERSVEAIVANYRDITERKRAEEDAQKRNQELAALNAITTAVSSSLELPEVLETFKRQVAEALDVPGGMVYFRDRATHELTLRDAWGLPESFLPELESLDMAGPHCGGRVREKKALLVHDFREVALFFAMRLDIARPDWQSYMCVPLVADDEIQGVVCLFSRAPSVFSEDQLPFFEALGQQVGVAIHNARLFEEVRSWRERLQTLSRRLVEVQEAERHHIARELHDEIGQLLTGLKLTLEMTSSSPLENTAENLAEAVHLVNELMAQVRQLSLDLRPAMLDDLGLLPALLCQFQRFEAQTGVSVAFDHRGLDRRFPPAVETAAYRIIQEALTNVARHAEVTEAMVKLRANASTLRVEVQDRGTGFDPRASVVAKSGCGLMGMRERAGLLSGKLDIESTPGAGTRLTAELPLGEPGTQGKEEKRDRCGSR